MTGEVQKKNKVRGESNVSPEDKSYNMLIKNYEAKIKNKLKVHG